MLPTSHGAIGIQLAVTLLTAYLDLITTTKG